MPASFFGALWPSMQMERHGAARQVMNRASAERSGRFSATAALAVIGMLPPMTVCDQVAGPQPPATGATPQAAR